MAVAVITSLGQQFDSSGDPLNGGSVTVYAATTTTPLDLFSNTGLSTPATNPITLDSAGRHAMTYIAAAAYKILVKDSGGSTVYTRDSIDPGVPIGSGTLAVANGGTGASTAAAALTNLGAASSADLTAVSSDVTTVSNLVTNVNPGKVLGGSFAAGGVAGNVAEQILPLGQVRLTKSGSNLLLSPYNGNLLMINSKLYAISSSGITLAVGGSAATFYYIYCYDNSGTLTLEQSTTAPATQTTTGIKIKNGDATRTLVGAAYTDTGPAWADTDGKLWVISHFNRKAKRSVSVFVGDKTSTSASYGEISSDLRNQFISWNDEYTTYQFVGSVTNSGANTNTTGISVDSTTAVDVEVTSGSSSNYQNASMSGRTQALTENALHYCTGLGKTTAGTATWKGSTGAGTLTLTVMG